MMKGGGLSCFESLDFTALGLYICLVGREDSGFLGCIVSAFDTEGEGFLLFSRAQGQEVRGGRGKGQVAEMGVQYGAVLIPRVLLYILVSTTLGWRRRVEGRIIMTVHFEFSQGLICLTCYCSHSHVSGS